jgi:hypothetical protein
MIAFEMAFRGDRGIAIAIVIVVIGLTALAVNRALSSLMIGLISPVWLVLFVPSGGHPPWTWDLSECSGRLFQISFAIQRFESEQHHFPPAFVTGPDGMLMHSWRVLILPYLSRRDPRGGATDGTYADVFARYRFDEPWDSPHNAALADLVDAYQCPALHRDKSVPSTATPYLAVVGDNACWPGAASRTPETFPDGMSRSLCLVEASPIENWMEPKDISADAAIDYLASDQSVHRAPSTTTWWDNSRPLYRRVAMADMHIELVDVKQPRPVAAAVVDVADGKPERHSETNFVRTKPYDPTLWIVAYLTLSAAPGFVPLVRRIATCIGRLATRRVLRRETSPKRAGETGDAAAIDRVS